MEIERKWILPAIPTDRAYKSKYYIRQGYLHADAEEIRIRSAELIDGEDCMDHFVITKKGPGGMIRPETNVKISAKTFVELLPLIPYNLIEKEYYLFEDGDCEIEVSNVDNGTLIYAEVEFSTVEEANNYNLPFDDAIEVTYDPRFKIKNYWNTTRIQGLAFYED